MSEEIVTNKTELLRAIDREWSALQVLLDSLTPRQLSGIRSPEGWAVKDHLAHLRDWEQSIIAFLSGMPRHEGLGIPEELYFGEDIDAMNQVLFQAHRETPAPDVRTLAQATHAKLLGLLAPLSDEDLKRPYRTFLPGEPGEGDGPPAFQVVLDNTADHYRDHRRWIEEMVAADESY